MVYKPSLEVGLGARSYPIYIARDILPQSAALVAPYLKHRAVVVTDKNVAKYHLQACVKMLEETGVKVECIILPAGESTKSFAHYQQLMEQLLAQKPERADVLVALGGGVVGDITGFAASSLLRGVPFIQIPTSLLAMVDSSVGGKTGINSQHGKNLIGAFYQPKAVVIDTKLLETLPTRQWRAGYAEVVKYGLIDDADFFAQLEVMQANPATQDIKNIYISCAAKARIVAADEHEKGQRALLNLGHTFGHALEAELGYDGRLLHGEAVAVGMVMAFQFAAYIGICAEEAAKRVAGHLHATGLPSSLADLAPHAWDPERLLAHMQQDKKNEAGQLTLILPRAIGQCEVVKAVSQHRVKAFLTT